MENINYKEYKGYFFLKKYENIIKKIIDKNYKIEKILKDTVRNYVVIINIDEEKYILKSPKAENIIPQRKFMTLFKNGEALNTLININKAREKGIIEFVDVYGAIVKRKNRMIVESFIIMEYIDGKTLDSLEEIKEVMEITKKLHKNNIYHGDLNTSNFLKAKNGMMRILDSQAKEEKNIYFKRWYDILTFKEDILTMEKGFEVEKNYLIRRKDIYYYLAKLLKKIKRNKFMAKIKEKKKELRRKGWRI